VNPDAIAESIAKIDRNNILGRPSNPYDVERVKLAPGLSGDPQQQWRLKQAETLAAHSQQIGPAGIEPMPGSLEAEKATEKFKALGHTLGTPGTARQGETTGIYTEPGQTPPLVYHEAFQSPRLPEGAQTQPPPPGSPPGTLPSVTTLPGATPAIQSAATAGIAGKAAIQPKLDAEKVASEDFGELRKAYQGNQGAMQNLQNFLNAAAIVGTGKGTSLSADAAAWLKSINVDPQKLSLADPAEVEKMRKASTQAVFGAIKGVSSRPAFQEFAMHWENNLFSAWDKSRRDTGSHLAFNLPEWVASNPIQGFQSSAYGDVPSIPSRGVVGGGNQPTHQTTGAAPKGLRYDPATKTLVPMQ
jgi:hypothetical protein